MPLCHEDERQVLQQFKRSFVINKLASRDPFAYPKTQSWKINTDCCRWDGIECDNSTHHVIGLDLSSSCLYGVINSNTTLFGLVHLKKLNLADNFFNYSQIPPEIRYFHSLTHLNLSRAAFYGQVPFEIAELIKLTSLDLSFNVYYSYSLLELKKPVFENLAQNLSRLEELQLSYVYISTSVPDVLANLSSLRTLILEDCRLQGILPTRIFQLPNLRFLSLNENSNLTGELPEFHQSSSLQVLRLASTSLYGKLPISIGSLQHLTELHIPGCPFFGLLPASLGNLTRLTYMNLALNNFIGEIPSSLANLSELTHISLSANNFTFGSFSWLGKLSKLTHLALARSNLAGEIPIPIRNLTQLQSLNIGENRLIGQIPLWLSNFSHLSSVLLESNLLHGPIPESISQLVNLQLLFLSGNRLSGTLKFDIFFNLMKLVYLDLSANSLSLVTNIDRNASFHKFKHLGLGLCNLKEFPDFLRFQDELQFLELAGNNIHGQIPEWIWNISRNSLWSIGLAYNSLTGFIKSSLVSQLVNLKVLDLSSNKLQGTLPMPPSSLNIYRVSNNSLSGTIPESICKLQFLSVLELANNDLTGTLPQCLANLSNSLYVLNLQNNSFHGTFPNIFTEGCPLRMIDLSQNQLYGFLPRSLAKCKILESLDLSYNRFTDTFPSWLGSLPRLQVLDLRSNKFYGTIGFPQADSDFPMLRIIDVSSNGFTGNLPAGYFKIWNNMKFFEAGELVYLQTGVNFPSGNYTWTAWFKYSLVLTKSGVEMTYNVIPSTVAVIDLSSNNFNGEIPESIGCLKMLFMLNLSNNHLTGRIPVSLKNITSLESLDLSLNNLSGEIPPELTQLTFLGFLNVSHNHLSGPIPRGKQFDTFQNSSYEGNLGLCGKPVSDSCGAYDDSPPPPHDASVEDDHGSISSVEIEWMTVSAGYVGGLIVGIVIGRIFTGKKHEWFMNTFGRRQPRRRQRRQH